MKVSEFTDEISITNAFHQWKEIRKKYEKYVSGAPVRGYKRNAPEEQMISLDEFHDAVNCVYDIFCQNAIAHEISKSLLLLFNEVKTFALDKDIKRHGDGFLQFRTSIANALCDILTENLDYGDTHQLLFYLDDMCVDYKEGYYVLEVSDLTFNYIGENVDLSKYARFDGTGE